MDCLLSLDIVRGIAMQNNQSIFEQPARELAKLGSRERKRLSNTICRGGKYNATKMMLISIARGTNTGNYFK